MRIAYLTSRLPYPPTSGGQRRSYHLLRHLAKSYEVRVYAIEPRLRGTVDTSAPEPPGLETRLFRISPAGYAWNAVKGLFSGLPFQVKLYKSPDLARALAEDVRRGQIDLLFVHLLRMADYVRPHAGIPRIFDMVDSFCLHYHRMPRMWRSPRWLAARLDRGRVCRYEAEMPTCFDWVLLSSPVDLAALRKKTCAENLILVPTGVDLERLTLSEGPIDRNRIIFVARLNYLPNLDAAIYFAREIFPLVKRSVPGAKFVIAGSYPPRAVRDLARLPDVVVRANVPDMRPEVAQSAVSVAPLRFGAGIQYKILESLALGIPVVATPMAARAFVHDTAGSILIGRDPEEFADQISRLLRDAAHRERARRAGRALVEAHYAWERVLAPLDRVLEGIESATRAGSARLAGSQPRELA